MASQIQIDKVKNELLNNVLFMRKIYKDYLPETAIDFGNNLISSLEGLTTEEAQEITDYVKPYLPFDCPYVCVWWYSVLISINKEPGLFKAFVKWTHENKNAFSLNTQYFLFCQFNVLLFQNHKLDGLDTKKEIWMFFMDIIDEYCFELNGLLEPVLMQERNENMVVVITDQFLGISHGPTKTALDRCKTIMTQLGKKVLLINTAETLSLVGAIPFANTHKGNYMINKVNESTQEWKGCSIPFFQCDEIMPDIDTLKLLLSNIRKIAPDFVVSIGGEGVLSNLVNRMIPVLSIGLCPSDLSYTTNKYQTISRKLTDEEKVLLNELGFSEKNIIEGIFTSGLKSQKEIVTRTQVGLPEDGFFMVVVGARLDVEVTDEFLSMLDEIIEDDMFVVFWGLFKEYDQILSKYPKLKGQSFYPGFCDDILSRMEIADLYINPIRKGGGTSGVEALYKGIPVISVNYGDVAVNVGNDFTVGDYREMQAQILRYYKDKDYYAEMSQKATERAEILLDTEKEFIRIIDEMRKREGCIE